MSHAEVDNLLESDEFRRLLAWSAGAHLVIAVALLMLPQYRPSFVEPLPIFVQVVSAAPRPAPPPPRQVVKEVVIPKQPTARPKKAPVEKAEPRPVAPTPEELLAQLRQKVAERPAEPSAPARASSGRFDPELLAYKKRVQALLYANWVGARLFRQQGELVARFEAEIDAAGRVRDLRLIQSSGNRHFDESAERAVQKVQPLPAPPRGALTLMLTFDPREA